MIFVGIDDTDILGARGTNQLAREIVRQAADRWTCRRIIRHQLLFDPRIPFTSKNGSASIALEPKNGSLLSELIELCLHVMQADFIPGSDPGLCVVESVPGAITEFGTLCQREIVVQSQARELAAAHGVFLDGLGGTEGGVIGALAAVGLAVTENDGRIIQWETWPDDMSGLQAVAALAARQVLVREFHRPVAVQHGWIDVGKHLRPNFRGGQAVVFVQPQTAADGQTIFSALKLT